MTKDNKTKNYAFNMILPAITIGGIAISLIMMHKAQTLNQQLKALNYMQERSKESREIAYNALEKEELLDAHIKTIQYIENKHIADSLKQECYKKQNNIITDAQKRIETQMELIQQIAKEYNINIR